MPRSNWSPSSSATSTTTILPISTSLDLSALSNLEYSCPRAQSLLQRIRSLESQLQQLRAERDTLQREFQASTQAALNSALDSLAALVSNVTEADRLLLFWHHKTATRPLRVAFKLLKPIGRDKEVHTLMARTSGTIRTNADEVSGAFELCGDVCQDSLIKVQQLHLRTNDLVTVGIHGLQNDAEDLRGGYEKKKKDLQLAIDQKGVGAGEVRRQASNTRAQVREAKERATEARRAAQNSKTLSAVGVGGAFLLGALCLVFPPAGAAAAGVGALASGAVGVSSAVVASDHSTDARRLGQEQRRFQSRVDNLEHELSSLRAEMSTLEGSKSGYDAAIRCARDLEAGCQQLRGQTNQFVKELTGARLLISQGITKSRGLAAALQRCEYARTRCDFVSRVQGVLDDFRACTIPNSSVGSPGNPCLGIMASDGQLAASSSQARLDKVTNQLVTVQRKTHRVIHVLSKAF